MEVLLVVMLSLYAESGCREAVKTLKAEGDLVSQLVRAASVAFGGGRKGDYPKAQIQHWHTQEVKFRFVEDCYLGL